MSNARLSFGGGPVLFALAAAFLAGPVWAQAQQRTPITYSIPSSATRYLQQQAIDVGDVPGHQVRLYEIRYDLSGTGLAFNGAKVKESFVRGLSDYTGASGQAQSYTVFVLEDGNKVFTRETGVSQSPWTPDGPKSIQFWVVSTITGGTGSFHTLRGQLRTSGARVPGATSLSSEITGEYWNEP